MKYNSFINLKKDCYISNGDSLEIIKEIDDNSVNLILTDPPYNLGKFMNNRGTNMGKLRENHFSATDWDHLTYEDWAKKMDQFLENSARVIMNGGSMIIFMSLMKVESIIKLAEKHGFYYKTTGIWHKKNPIPRNMNLHFVNSTEGWIYFTYKKKTGVFNNEKKLEHDFFESGLTPGSEKRHGGHPTQKPEILIKHFIKLLSNENDVVLDPFMGSGTTGKVASEMNRKFIGIELSDKYFKMSKERILG